MNMSISHHLITAPPRVAGKVESVSAASRSLACSAQGTCPARHPPPPFPPPRPSGVAPDTPFHHHALPPPLPSSHFPPNSPTAPRQRTTRRRPATTRPMKVGCGGLGRPCPRRRGCRWFSGFLPPASQTGRRPRSRGGAGGGAGWSAAAPPPPIGETRWWWPRPAFDGRIVFCAGGGGTRSGAQLCDRREEEEGGGRAGTCGRAGALPCLSLAPRLAGVVNSGPDPIFFFHILFSAGTPACGPPRTCTRIPPHTPGV